jgi:DNA sulfur modification protein DndB
VSEVGALRICSMLLSAKSIPATTRKRLDPHELVTVSAALQSEYEADGWVLEKALKRGVKMRRLKAHDVAFEDRVWATFASLNFPALNADRRFILAYGGSPNERKQIDVFVADEEVVLVIECKSAARPASHAFKSEIEAIQGTRQGIIRAIQAEFPKRKIKFVLATNNYVVSPATLDRIEAADIIHLDEDAIDYYLDLAKHLGKAARFQLLGRLFAGTKIPGLEPAVSAIEGRMGGHKYYAFMIEPARLLKLAYILHRDKANSLLMPTYQRIIKKARLRKVSDFVENGGFFPNSIVLNIEAGRRGLRFDRASTVGDGAKLGTLHLPQTFRSAYVIDGQHRLYGYADSELAATELIPVVAFVSLPRAEQVRLFMQINENQKAVPKNLRNTLNADLLWSSDDLSERARALRLRLAQHLEEKKTSPLHGRIIVGEDRATELRCITIDALSRGVDRGRFIGSFTSTEIKEAGSFYRGDQEATFDQVAAFLELALSRLREGLESQWSLGRAEGGFVFMNNGVESFLRVLGDVVDHLIVREKVDPLKEPAVDVYAEVEPYIDVIVEFLGNLPRDESQELRRQYGSAGGAQYWRKLQEALATSVPDFEPPGLAEYLADQDKKFNTEAFGIIRDIELFLKRDIRTKLEDQFGTAWFKRGVPVKVYREASTLAIEKNRELDSTDEVEPWDCLHIRDYQQILQNDHALWVERFATTYTRPEDEGKPGGWKAKTNWLAELNRIRNENDHTYSVKESEYDLLVSLKTWLGV